MTGNHEVWITGIGLLSALGEGGDHHWKQLGQQASNAPIPEPVLDRSNFDPYCVYPLKEPDWTNQISRRDKRQMEPWQQIGTYTAGLALDDAGLKGDEALCSTMDMIVAAGGGERDIEADSAILADCSGAADRDVLINERLSNDLRPTLFLAQLSNLLAGNISIVHKVTGSSRTFMGEEGAGMSAIQNGFSRIRSGQSDHMLVGGAYNAERKDMMLTFELGQFLWHDQPKGVAARANSGKGGIMLGSVGIFLVLESRAHAEARNKQPYARITTVATDHGPRSSGAASQRGKSMLAGMASSENYHILSGASGIADIYRDEMAVFDQKPVIRHYGSQFGHCVEAQFPLGIALAALAVSRQQFYPPFETGEQATTEATDNILVSGFGHWRSEALAMVSKTSTTGGA